MRVRKRESGIKTKTKTMLTETVVSDTGEENNRVATVHTKKRQESTDDDDSNRQCTENCSQHVNQCRKRKTSLQA